LSTWTLTGATTEYTVAARGDRLDLVAWGPIGVSDGPSPYDFHGRVQYLLPGDVAAAEYLPDGLRPFLGADLSVSGHGLTWRLVRTDEHDGLTATFADAVTGLEAQLRWRFAPGTDVLERWASVRNGGDRPLEITQLGSAAFNVPTPNGATLHYLHGQWAQEFTTASTTLVRGRFEIGSAQGVTGHQFSPGLAVDNGDALYGFQLAWSGSWSITADVDAAGLTRVRAGRAGPVRLAPGEIVTTPVALGVYAEDDLARHWHAYERSLAAERLPRAGRVIYNSWEATTFDVTAAGQLALADVAARLGVETFVVDDGWFVGRHDDTGGLGDWTPDPAKFPDGFDAFVAAVRERGLEFGLWVEPEMVNPRSALYAAHPEWAYQADGRPRSTIRNQYLLDLGRVEVYEFVRDTLDRLLTDYPIGYLKWDFNRPRTEADRSAADLDGAHVRNLYRLLDHLRSAHPDVTIEGCAAGGARVDLAMAARTDVLWPSDNTAPLDRLRIQHGFLSAHAPHLMSSWVTDAPGMFDPRPRSLAFRFVLAAAGVLGIGADITKWSPEERDEAAAWVARYKQVRDVILRGTVHRIGSPDQARCAVQYTLGDRVVVLAWNPVGLDGGGAVPARDVRLPLHGLPPGARYRVVPTALPRPAQPDPSQSDPTQLDGIRPSTTQLDTSQPDCGEDAPAPAMPGPAGGFEASGRHLTSAGLPVRWTAAYDADLFELERL
jgi:alpha-galactosidase